MVSCCQLLSCQYQWSILFARCPAQCHLSDLILWMKSITWIVSTLIFFGRFLMMMHILFHEQSSIDVPLWSLQICYNSLIISSLNFSVISFWRSLITWKTKPSIFLFVNGFSLPSTKKKHTCQAIVLTEFFLPFLLLIDIICTSLVCQSYQQLMIQF